MNRKDYCCIKACFADTKLTMSVNVLSRASIDQVYSAALAYFNSKSKWQVEKLILFNNESDMHLNSNVQGVYLVQNKTNVLCIRKN